MLLIFTQKFVINEKIQILKKIPNESTDERRYFIFNKSPYIINRISIYIPANQYILVYYVN